MTHPHGQQQQYMYGIYRKEAFAIFDLHRCRCIDFQKLSLLVHHRSTITVSPLNVSCNISPSLIKSYLQARGGNSKGDQYVTHTDLLRDPPSLFFLNCFNSFAPSCHHAAFPVSHVLCLSLRPTTTLPSVVSNQGT